MCVCVFSPAFPVVGWVVDPQLYRTSRPEAAQLPQGPIHEDFPAGNATKIQRAVGRATSSQREESSESGCHINASHGPSEMAGKTASPPRSYPPGFASPSYASEMRHWQEEGFVERRNLQSHQARNGESSWKAGIESKAYRLRLSRSSRKLLHRFRRVRSYEATTPASSLSSSSSSFSVALQPRKRARFSLHLSAAPQRRKMSLGRKQRRRQQTGPSVAMTKGVSAEEKLWKCPICGCEESHLGSGAQRGLDQLSDAASSKGLFDVASQQLPSNTAPPKGNVLFTTLYCMIMMTL